MELYYKVLARLTQVVTDFREEHGQTMTEYALLIALIALLLLGAIAILEGGISNIFSGAGAKLSSVTT